MDAADLIAFEAEVARRFEAKEIHGPVHLSGAGEEELIEIFADIKRTDWVASTYRNHYHALLHGVPRAKVMAEILRGRSMNLSFPEHRFLTSAIVGGMLPIATGIAAGIKRKGGAEHVWCFLGDMAEMTGAFAEANRYANGFNLPITFVIEDNGLSCDTPTGEVWGNEWGPLNVRCYSYTRRYPHAGIGHNVF